MIAQGAFGIRQVTERNTSNPGQSAPQKVVWMPDGLFTILGCV